MGVQWIAPLRICAEDDLVALRIPLGVERQQVVLGKSESADGRLQFYAAVRAMPVVAVEPGRQPDHGRAAGRDPGQGDIADLVHRFFRRPAKGRAPGRSGTTAI